MWIIVKEGKECRTKVHNDATKNNPGMKRLGSSVESRYFQFVHSTYERMALHS
jgi:hypothetical protein